MNPNQYAPLPPHKNYTYKPSQRSKSPIGGQIQTTPRDDRNKISPIKYPVHLPNTQQFSQQHKVNQTAHQHVQPPFQQLLPGQKPGTAGAVEKENSRVVTDNRNAVGNVNAEQADMKISAIDRVIMNCNIMNLNSPTKNKYASNPNSNHERRASTPQNIQNYQTFHQQQQQHQPHPPVPQQQQQAPPPLQNPYVNLPQQTSSYHQQFSCFNKDGKKAKYARADNPQEAYCAKCSIVLVGAGIKMIDIEAPQNFQSAKQKQLKNFISEIHNLKNNISREINSIRTEKQRIVYHLQQQKEDVCKRYTQIFSLFKQFQHKDLNLINQFEHESLKKLSDFEYQFKKSWERVDLMIKDISPNIQMIKLHISEDQFKGFMQDYHSQVKSIIGRLDAFNLTWKDVKPYTIKREVLDRFNYEACGQLMKEEKNMVYFSFERKGGVEEKEPDAEESVGVARSIPRIQITSQDSWKRENEPFRVLFTEEQPKEEIPSPTFKKL